MHSPIVHCSLNFPRTFGYALGIGIGIQFGIHLLLLYVQLLTQLVHVPDLFLPGLLLIRIQPVHQPLMFLFHLSDLIPDMDLLLIQLTIINLFPGVFSHLPRLFANIIRQFVTRTYLVPLLFGSFDAFMLHLSVGGLSSTLSLAHYLSLALFLPLPLALSSTAATATLSLRKCSRKQKQKNWKYNQRSFQHDTSSFKPNAQQLKP
jgi:hypothetical protein